LPNEDVSEFERFRFDVHREFDPRGAVEIRLVETAASLMWRLRRVPAFEAALFARTAAIRKIAAMYSGKGVIGSGLNTAPTTDLMNQRAIDSEVATQSSLTLRDVNAREKSEPFRERHPVHGGPCMTP
jgi:hypothetical protein